MNFPRHWSFAKSGRGQAWGWSDVSLAAAQAAARERAAKVDALLRGSARPDRAAEYYPGQPMREPVLRELAGPDGGLAAVVTRNTYGADILNAADALFVDVDLPEPAQPGLLARLFGAKAPPPGQPSPAESAAVARAEAWANAHPGWGWRVYRTAAGLRLLATHATFDPADPFVREAFRQLQADPLYARLCVSQACFRARLTPKPWRVGLRGEPPRWPWAEAATEQVFAAWERAYRQAAQAHATCTLVRTIGTTEIHPDLRALVVLHDEACKVGSGLPLA